MKLPWDSGKKQAIKHLLKGWDNREKITLKVGTAEKNLGTVEKIVGTVEKIENCQSFILQRLQRVLCSSPLFPRIIPKYLTIRINSKSQ